MRFLFALVALGCAFLAGPAFADAASETRVVSYFAKEGQYERLGPDYANRLSDGNTIEDVLKAITLEIPVGTAVAVAAKTPDGFHVMFGRQGDDLPVLYFYKSTEGAVEIYPLTEKSEAAEMSLVAMALMSTHMLNFIAPARLLEANVPKEEVAALLAPAEKLLNDFANEQH